MPTAPRARHFGCWRHPHAAQGIELLRKRNSKSTLKYILPLLGVVGVVGCATWKDTTPSEIEVDSRNTATLGSRKQVLLDVEFVNIATDIGDLTDVEDVDQSNAYWQWVDETAVDVTARQRLIANGIRVGAVANEERFRQRLAAASTEQDVVEEFLSRASVASDVSHGEKRIPMRFGRRYELPLRQPIEGSHVALVRLEGETIGRTLNHAQYFFGITATRAAGQKQVHLKFRPEVHFGDARQKWISSESAIRIDTQRDSWSIPELDIELKASEGDLLVFAADTPVSGLAKHMLSGQGTHHDPQQVVVLVRVAQVPSTVDQL